jgi:hypothetical protein
MREKILTMRRRALAFLLLFGTLRGARAQELHPWGAELQPVLEVLNQAGLSGSIELSGRCDPAHPPGFPKFHGAAMSRGSSLQALRGIVADDFSMKVEQDPDGTIRMRETGVPQDMLNVRISHVSFETYGHKGIYTADSAVQIIMSTPEVVAFLKKHDILWRRWGAGSGIGGGIRNWPPGRPHLVGPLDNVTVSEALDRVLQSFFGEVLVYWNCPATHDDVNQRPAESSQTPKAAPSFFPHCLAESSEHAQSVVVPAGLPDILCTPPSAFRLPWFLTLQSQTSRTREVIFRFFSLQTFGGRLLVVGG